MRLLVVTHHFYDGESGSLKVASSRVEPLARIAAVNAAIVALHRHFGPRRHGRAPGMRLPDDRTPERVLDIVVLAVPGKSIIDQVGIDPSLYTLDHWDGPPIMLGFETQRVLRERAGNYDYYFIIEDDMVIHDPLFIEKLAWFENAFGTTRLLQPLRYEMAQSGTPALVSAWPVIPHDTMRGLGMRRDGQPPRLAGSWHGREQSFVLPDNPHVGGIFLSDAQLRHWMGTPWFYDRDTSFAGPLESAMNLSLCRAFDVYRPSAPDPFFLAIEHFGTRYARAHAPSGVTYGDQPLLEIAHAALHGDDPSEGARSVRHLLDQSARGLNALARERDAIFGELTALKRSRSKLFKALWKAIWKSRSV